MPRGNYNIQRVCEECGKIFTPENLHSPDAHIKVLLLCLFQEGIQEKTNRKREGRHTASIGKTDSINQRVLDR